MLDSPFSPRTTPTVQVSAALEPVLNILLSAWAITTDDAVSVDAWVARAAETLTPVQREENRLIFAVFGGLLLLDEPAADFPTYLAALAGQPDATFEERLSAALPALADPVLRARAVEWLASAPSPKERIVSHLRGVWEGMLAAEWQRHIHLQNKMTRAINELIFSQPQWQSANPVYALRFLLQIEPEESQLAQLAGVQRIVLVWSPHLLAHCTHLGRNDTLWVVRTFDPQLLRRDPLRRAEVLGPLNALADETRLRILELLVEHGEQRAQEIIAQLEGSQGNVSRHLKQLVGAGFASERRAGDANKHYTYEPAGLRRLIFLTQQLLTSRNAQAIGAEVAAALQLSQVRAIAPPALHDLVDEQGRIMRWPGKLKEQDALLGYLAEKFEMERTYHEQEVNKLLQLWYCDDDYVLVRRSLVDAGLLRRTKDGARYWRG
jgi:DNA-binding transcriptional ArsR family regulator